MSYWRGWSAPTYPVVKPFSRESLSAWSATDRQRWRPRQQLARSDPFSISNCVRTERQSIRGRGGRRQTSKRRADESECWSLGFRRRARRRGDAGGAADARLPQPRQGGGLGHVPPAEPVRRRVRQDPQRLRGKARQVQAHRGRDQRHAVFARPTLELHGREGVQGHAGPDQGRVRRPRHRGDPGGRPDQGRDPDRRHACGQGRHHVGRHHHRHRRHADAGADPRSGGREDARGRSTRPSSSRSSAGQRRRSRITPSSGTSSGSSPFARASRTATSATSASPSLPSRPRTA